MERCGGDFSHHSATLTIGGLGPVSVESVGLIADVQRWLDDPESNFGWILLTDAVGGSAKRFSSREVPNGRPTLTVTVSPPQ